uniref:Uncharacterized protein n=1 Tax=Physcomitrium patens TaxID=3218 RepID=A0A2K1J4I0_PHYPA|nr:hypothetical protein PHYPA_022279 [Physcomitrium patens]
MLLKHHFLFASCLQRILPLITSLQRNSAEGSSAMTTKQAGSKEGKYITL